MKRLRFIAVLTTSAAVVQIGCYAPTEDNGARAPGPTESTTSDLVTDVPLYDGPTCRTYTQVGGVHRCPLGSAMTGVHFGMNMFRCRQIQPPQNEGSCISLTNSTRNSMAACTENNYLAGFNVSSNAPLCCPYPSNNKPTSSRIDGNDSWLVMFDPYRPSGSSKFVWDAPEAPTQATMHAPADCNFSTMTVNLHACLDGEVMEGVHIGNNDFTCAQ